MNHHSTMRLVCRHETAQRLLEPAHDEIYTRVRDGRAVPAGTECSFAFSRMPVFWESFKRIEAVESAGDVFVV